PHEFAARTHYGDVDGASLIDWPLAAAELAPYYDRAEARMGVTGTGDIPLNATNNNYRVLYHGARRLGYRRISNAGIAINSVQRDGRPACIQLGFCNQGCKVSAKWSTLVAEIPRALATGRLELRPDCMALRLETDEDDRVIAVVYADATGNEQRQAARAVCVAGNAIETPRLLLNSATGRHPDGLGNDSGELGRHYMRHVSALGFAAFEQPVNMHRGITTPGTVFDEDDRVIAVV
ncbi:MAG: GMC family oxidoreductase N-terminal domain-containing protein, partial [Actinomycetota bacterium]